MTLASPQFLLFLTAVWLLWRYAAPGSTARKALLLAASYGFYATWDFRFVPLLLATALVQWWLGARIASAAHPVARRAWLGASLAFGLGLLFYFKYAGFFVVELSTLLSSAGLASLAPMASIAAPIGISFYTFLSLSYTIDIHRGHAEPTRSLLDFALYIAFFGHVTAGPVTRARSLLPQLARVERTTPLTAAAVFLIVRGLLKKLVFSDLLAAEFVRPAFAAPGDFSPWFLLVALFAYSFQIYMDVSGYTDIARGTARCFGYDLMLNFDRPYLARSVSNFWQRWHISVSSFFRDYVYFALGGSRRGNVYINLLVTFIAIGLWHGAGWNFVVYGCLHGSAVCIERWRRTHRRTLWLAATTPAAPWLAIAATFAFVAMSRILFVAEDLPAAGQYLRAMLGGAAPHAAGSASAQAYVALAGAALLHWLPGGWQSTVANRFFARNFWQHGIAYASLAILLIAWGAAPQPFVYFRF
jgi:alginate O-acetyltransferase complex protein AlgI